MIGSLHGKLLHKAPPGLMLEVNGVGYEMDAPMSTFVQLPAIGEAAQVFTHLQVREDAHTLYAFASLNDRSLFRALLRVTGVGAKMALAILSGMNAGEFAACVANHDVHTLTRLPGIGKKTAERLMIDMRDRLPILRLGGGPVVTGVAAAGGAVTVDAGAEAVNALIALGYKPHEASRLVRGLNTGGMSVEDIVRAVLKGLANS